MTTPPDAADPSALEAPLLAELDAAGVAYLIHRHPAVHTVAESMDHRGDLPGAHIKNMFLKDKKGGLWLVTCAEERRIQLKDLEKAVGAPRVSFGKPDLLWETLGVRPGSVTPLALFNDRAARRVTPLLDAQVMAQERLCPHPLHNEATLSITTADLSALLARWGHTPRLVDFDALEAQAAARAAEA